MACVWDIHAFRSATIRLELRSNAFDPGKRVAFITILRRWNAGHRGLRECQQASD